ncbi:PAS domain S-box-containing protein/diguanylate cyclase (GGDEF)-like protein [Kineococcus xinjiangensis]|uniref:PAS domain S-box-containing protein/diguanylate cyclase (GGDEF)-like protein n=1 Tax=Kineococcus xinjiangensis TaxID=512762 RepID=A0A2S6IFZ0_9ACTN|nr:EAL domain-containing protein [Kineococcus xinjiangensis]PPK93128.1 PAS domain S-box-containing protein/diguanylate cyclase (GGDEF)-like protein [Kineococcus xinjiangensis]
MHEDCGRDDGDAASTHAILTGALDGVAACSADGRITEFNPVAQSMYGWGREEALGRDLVELLMPAADRDAKRRAIGAHLAGEDSGLVGHRVDVLGLRRSGELFPLELSVIDLGRDPGRFVIFMRDVSERHRAEQRLRELAELDGLTGLANRATFTGALAVACSAEERGSVMLLDLDSFKLVNDTLGHRAGDECLHHVADVLRSRTRQGDLVARVGGDEFAVLLPTIPPAAARRIGQDLLRLLRERPLVLGSRPVRVSASIGIAALSPGEPPEEVLHRADAAMYQAKQAGRDRVAVFSDVAGAARITSAHAGQAQRLRNVLADDGLVLWAQPIVEARTGAVRCVELLARLADGGGGVLMPAAFLPAAERFDLVQRLDAQVVTAAAALLRRADAAGVAAPLLHVNLSGRSLSDDGVLETIEEQLGNVDAAHFVFEVTETAAVTQLDTAVRFARRLAAMGCGLALDDFGAGYASFTYLKHLPVQLVKIDGEFVRGILTDRLDRAVVRAAVSVAMDMGYLTVAEYVENAELLAEVRGFEVDLVQGFHLGRPQRAEVVLGLEPA